MNEDHKLKLAQARREALKLKNIRETALVADYREWIKLERQAYEQLLKARMLGNGVHEAHKEFVAAWSIMPKLAPDSAWRRGRGDIQELMEATS